MYKSFLLNTLSLVSIYTFELVLEPLVRDQERWLHRNLGWIYHVMWLLPVLGASFYFNVRPIFPCIPCCLLGLRLTNGFFIGCLELLGQPNSKTDVCPPARRAGSHSPTRGLHRDAQSHRDVCVQSRDGLYVAACVLRAGDYTLRRPGGCVCILLLD